MPKRKTDTTLAWSERAHQWTDCKDIWRAAIRRSSSMLSNCSLSHCLQRGYHCYRKAKNLKIESEARRKKIHSITILLRIVHKFQVIDANTSRKRRLLLPVRFACSSRNSPRSRACHLGPRALETNLQRKRAAGRANIIWCVVSRTTHIEGRGHYLAHGVSLPPPQRVDDPVVAATQRS
jgi:hypothetical protein